MSTTTRTRTFLVALLLSIAPAALAHEPGEDNELPDGGTVHEFRVTSITSLTVAQQITQPVLCGNPFICLQDQIHLPVVINFQTGEIAIDATAPDDENEMAVPPGGPGGMLFNTQSGPAELVLAPPCENPDGCVGGSSVYLGTIDAAGNIRFPSIGMHFQVFGIEPIAMFDAAMGTGSSTDASDPSVVATGSRLDFATGALTLRGIQLVASPIIGNALQLNTIRGTIVPVPAPPAKPKDVFKCQRAFTSRGSSFVKKKLKALHRCTGELLECKVRAEAGVPSAGCTSSAVLTCDSMVEKIEKAEQQLKEKLEKSCANLVGGNLLATNRGLNFAANVPQCAAFGIDASTMVGLAACAVRDLECGVELIVARSEPRAEEVLAENGFADFLAPTGCLVPFAAGDAAGADAGALLSCRSAMEKRSQKYVTDKQRRLGKCVEAVVGCELEERLDGLEGAALAACQARAQTKCDDAVSKLNSAAASRDSKIAGACGDVDAPGIPALAQGLGFANLADLCQGQNPPVNLNSLADLLSCLGASWDCAAESIVRRLEPQAGEIAGDVSVGPDTLLDLFPCLEGVCGDGIIDVGEGCDPLFPTDNTCNPDCTAVVCGDGDVEGDEECDDGNTNSGDGCSSACIVEPSVCGDSITEGVEVCDDGDSHGGDGCSANCQSNETCGNGVIDTIVGETCDDSNTMDGDGCSANCRSDETCGNGVIDATTGEACDDGNTSAGDGCDASCAFESCGFFNSGSPLGTRDFSVDTTVGGLFNSIIGLGTPVGPISFVSGPFELSAAATDGTGNATVTLNGDVIIGLNVAGGGFTQCLKFEAAGTVGTLHCCGGHAVDMSFTRDSDGTKANGPSIVLTGIGTGGPGDLEIAFQVRQGAAPLATPGDCLTATFGGVFTQSWTSGAATGRVVRPIQGPGPLEFTTTGQAFDCSMWTTENDVGALVNADTALNAIPGVFDAANLRVFDDQAGD